MCNSVDCVSALHSRPTSFSSMTQTEYDVSNASQIIHPFQPLGHTPFNTQDSCLLVHDGPNGICFNVATEK